MKPHTIILSENGSVTARIEVAGVSLKGVKEDALTASEEAPELSVAILTNRGTTWKLKGGRWVHDTGRKG